MSQQQGKDFWASILLLLNFHYLFNSAKFRSTGWGCRKVEITVHVELWDSNRRSRKRLSFLNFYTVSLITVGVTLLLIIITVSCPNEQIEKCHAQLVWGHLSALSVNNKTRSGAFCLVHGSFLSFEIRYKEKHYTYLLKSSEHLQFSVRKTYCLT